MPRSPTIHWKTSPPVYYIDIYCIRAVLLVSWDGIFKHVRGPGIDSKESMPPAYVAWRAGTTNYIPARFLVPKDCLKIPALLSQHEYCLQSGITVSHATLQKMQHSLESSPFLLCITYFLNVYCTVICFVSIHAKFGIYTVAGLNGTLVEAKTST